MKVATTLAVLGSVALSAAQFKYNEGDNTFTCSQSTGVAAYCAGGDIIIRCANGIGHADNCNDNLAGSPPLGDDGSAGCYQSNPRSGDAACTKAGLVYPGSGSGASNKTAPYPIPGSVAGTNATSSATVAPAQLTAAPSAGTGGPFTFVTMHTTKVIYTDCGNGTTTSAQGSQGPVSLNGGQHHWPNTTSTIVVIPEPITSATPYLTISAPQAAAPTFASQAAAITNTQAVTTVTASATAVPATTSGSSFTGAAAAWGPAKLAPYYLTFAAVATLALF